MLVEEVAINLGRLAAIGNGFPIRASLLADLEGKEHPLLQRFPTTLNDLLSFIKVKTDRWIQVDATGLGCLAAWGVEAA